jgi:hypothetical protein
MLRIARRRAARIPYARLFTGLQGRSKTRPVRQRAFYMRAGTPLPLFMYVLQRLDLSGLPCVSADSKGVRKTFSVSADSKELSELKSDSWLGFDVALFRAADPEARRGFVRAFFRGLIRELA